MKHILALHQNGFCRALSKTCHKFTDFHFSSSQKQIIILFFSPIQKYNRTALNHTSDGSSIRVTSFTFWSKLCYCCVVFQKRARTSEHSHCWRVVMDTQQQLCGQKINQTKPKGEQSAGHEKHNVNSVIS